MFSCYKKNVNSASLYVSCNLGNQKLRKIFKKSCSGLHQGSGLFLNEEFLRMRILCKLSREKYETAAGTVLGTHLRVIFPIVIHIGVSTCNSALYIFLRHGTGG